MQNALGLARSPCGIQHKERMFCLVPDNRVAGWLGWHYLVEPFISALNPVDGLLVACNHEYVFHRMTLSGQGIINDWLEHIGFTTTVGPISGDDHLGFGIIDAGTQRFGRKTTKDY